ncbi:MAG: hypothetical protein LC131_16895 [Anaerolineae bacterium]|nr:hypothetical protein [Anaerolineae bacterium]
MTGDVPDRPLPAGSMTARPHAVGQIGDWLAYTGDAAAVLPVRTTDARWRAERLALDWHWTSTTPSEGWQGSPVSQIQTGDWTAWLIGELFGTTDPDQTVARLLEGHIAADRLNGHFLLVAVNNLSSELHIWTDRHATLHAYIASQGLRTAVGTFLPSVAKAVGRNDLDWVGLTSFFGFGFFAADRTHFDGVRILRPAMHYRLDRHGRLLAEERYWQWRYSPDGSRSYDETVEEFAAIFATVMSEMTAANRVAVPISGGLDSRSTVATIIADRPDLERFWAFSYGYDEESVETRIARKVAAARSLPFTSFVVRPYLFGRLAQAIGSVEGFQDVTMARQIAIEGDIHRHADRVIAAHWGDVYLDDMGLATLAPGSLSNDQLVDSALAKFSKPYGELLGILCQPHLGGREPAVVLRELMSDELKRLPDIADPDFLIKALKTEQWSARWTTASIRAFQAAAFPRLPFYDTRLSDFFTTVPTAFVAGRRLQIDYLKRYAPDLAAVEWQVTGANLFKAGRPDPWTAVKRAINKGRRKLEGRVVIERNWEVQFLGPEGRQGLEYWLLRPGLTIYEFISPQRLAALIEAFYESPWADKRSYPMAMLLTFSAWLELQGGRVRPTS